MTIKAGDLVFHRPTRDTYLVLTVHLERSTLGVSLARGNPQQRYLDLHDCDLRTVCTAEREQEIITEGAKEHGTTRARWCRAEMLRRGWRPIEPDDVKLTPLLEEVTLDGHVLGTIGLDEAGVPMWQVKDGEPQAAETRDGALAALLAAVNAGPAQPETQPERKRGRSARA